MHSETALRQKGHTRSPRVLRLVAVWVLSCSGVAATATSAVAHDALPTAAQPNGWKYPFSCCAGFDCRAVPQTAVRERPEGYVIQRTGEVLGYRDARLRDSPDGEFHWCSVAGSDSGRTVCLFVPPRSF
ncbi:hypothetical protein [Pseudaminobacter soli (ex Zhang et al. 2022)]|uniref:hypothetical protein n=1 Tax=Pseudaminobacter soli (ex Zhang et al. 2022) TaxID=2831468 RepID=UPI003CC7E339